MGVRLMYKYLYERQDKCPIHKMDGWMEQNAYLRGKKGASFV